MSDKKYVIAVDLGTSGPKLAILDNDFEMVAHDFEGNTVQFLKGGGAEQDPKQWTSSIEQGVKRMLDNADIDRSKVEGISITSQWSGTVALDNKGEPLMPAIIWMDSRGCKALSKVTSGFPLVEGYGLSKIWKWMKLTGGAPGHGGKDPIAHILYIKENHPEVYKNTYKFLEPKDYINYKLTGKFTSTHETMTLHWVTDNRDINNIKYDDGLLKMCQLDKDKLPEMVKSTDCIGTITKEIATELGLREDVKVFGGTPDIQSAAIGAGTVKDFEANLCIGTSSFLTCHVPFKKTDIFHSMASLPSGIPGKYLLINEQETAGACINFLKDNILFAEDALKTEKGDKDIHKLFDELANSIPAGSEGMMFTPWLYGERTPIEDHTIRGGFHNMSMNHNRSHMVKAVMEGVAYNTRWLLKYVEKFISKPCNKINFVGGGAMSDAWCQILADVLQREIHQTESPRHANARGAAAIALVGLGLGDFETFANKTSIKKVYSPNANHTNLYNNGFKEFINTYNSHKKIHARLNKQA